MTVGTVDFDAIAKAASPGALADAIGAKKPKRGPNYHCPNAGGHANGDKNPSLSIDRKDGRTVAHCFGCGLSGSPVQLASELWSMSPSDAAERLAGKLGIQTATRNRSRSRFEIQETYPYTDEDEQTLFEVVRLKPKDFRQRRPDGNGGWEWRLDGVRRVLYRLPAIIEAVALGKLIHVVEGEKDVHAIEETGGIATCNPGGAGAWRDRYSETLRDARVRIVADRDAAGREHARAVAASLEGVAESVEIVEAAEGKDAADHLSARYGLDDFVPLGTESADEDEAELLFVPQEIRFGRFLDSEPPEREWVLEEVLPRGVVGLLASMGGAGKSYFIYRAGLSVATGLPFLGMEVGEPGGFLYLAAEDDEDELHRRGLTLIGHCASLAAEAGIPFDREAVAERLYVTSRVAQDNLLTRTVSSGEVEPTALVERLAEAASAIPNLRVGVIDPVSRFRGGQANREEDATRFVETLERLRQETGATWLGLTHVSQAGIREGGGQEIVRGSTALVDGVRWVGTLQPLRRDQAGDYGLHEDEASRHLRFEIPKNNYAAPFDGLWIRREAGGVMVPTDLEETGRSGQARKAEREYLEIVQRLQKLLRDEGPLTRNAIRKYTGLAGLLGAGDKTVRAVIERAVRDGSLIEREGDLHTPREVSK